jgi:outer membrane protein
MKPTHFVRGMIVAGMMSCSGLAHGQSITDALTAAYAYSPDLESALLGAKSAAENIVQAKSGKLPTIAASLGGTYGGTLTQDGFSDSTQLSAGLQYNQTIFDNFRTDAQIEAARAGAEAAEHQIRNAELNVLLSVVQAYMQVLTGRQILTLRAESLDFFRAQLSSAQDRLEVGEGTRIDVAQARARLAQGEATYQAAANSLEISAATFQRHIGAAPGSLSGSHNFARLIPADLATAISSAEAAHPAILMAKASIRAAQASSDVAQAAFGPTASITGQVGTSITNPGGFQGIDGRIGFNITVPIYSGGSMGAGVRQANIEQIRSEVDAMSAYDQIREAVISAWAGIQSADAQITAATAAASAGQEVLSGVIQERDLGTRTTLDVLNAQAEVITARETQINASSNKVLATFSLLAAMGRLTAQDLNLPVTVKTAAPYTQAVEDVWQELRAIAE